MLKKKIPKIADIFKICRELLGFEMIAKIVFWTRFKFRKSRTIFLIPNDEKFHRQDVFFNLEIELVIPFLQIQVLVCFTETVTSFGHF